MSYGRPKGDLCLLILLLFGVAVRVMQVSLVK